MKFTPGQWAKPISWIYGGIMGLRNLAYDRQWFRSLRFAPAIINCGNLSVGGTGKSPHTEYLTALLLDHYQVGILSRGYGRKTKGYVLVQAGESAISVGDEPWQYHLRFAAADVTIAVDERRAEGIPLMVQTNPMLKAIILDDAYQHRRVKPSQNLLLTTFQHPFWRDDVLPAGWLREPKKGANRADALIITKAPDDLTLSEQQRYLKEANAWLKPNTPVFFSTLIYKSPRVVSMVGPAANNILPSLEGVNIGGFCGIASPAPFKAHLSTLGSGKAILKSFIQLEDHVEITHALLDDLYAKTQQEEIKVWFCTAKDRAKLLASDLQNHPMIELCWYIPIGINFLDHLSPIPFDDWLIKQVNATLSAAGQ